MRDTEHRGGSCDSAGQEENYGLGQEREGILRNKPGLAYLHDSLGVFVHQEPDALVTPLLQDSGNQSPVDSAPPLGLHDLGDPVDESLVLRLIRQLVVDQLHLNT